MQRQLGGYVRLVAAVYMLKQFMGLFSCDIVKLKENIQC